MALRFRLVSTRIKCSRSASTTHAGLYLVENPDAAGGLDDRRFDHLVGQLAQFQPLALRRQFLGPAKLQCLAEEFNGAVQRTDEFRRKALDRRVFHIGKAVGNKLGRGEHVAQVMADLADRQAQGREMVFLLQHGGKLGLHAVQLALGNADFIPPRPRLYDARKIFRVLAELHHVAGEPLHGLHQHPVQRRKNHPRHQQREENGKQENVDAVAEHGGPQRLFVKCDFNEVAGHVGRLVHHPDHPGFAGQHGAEGIGDGLVPHGAAEIEAGIDHEVAVAAQRQFAAFAFFQGHDEDARPHQDLAAQIAGEDLVRGGFGGKRGDFRLGDAPLQPLDAEVCNGGQEDENFAQHHEDDG